MTARKRERKSGGGRAPKKSVGRGKKGKNTSTGKKKPAGRRASSKSRSPAPLERLRADEPGQVLRSLICRHPELRNEANELSLQLVAAVDAGSLGSELGRRLVELDIFDAADGARRDGRYVPLWEAAEQTLDGLLEPYLTDLQRRIELGLKEAAQATCLGIVLGLHWAQKNESDDSLLAHAPDFCANEADYAVQLLAKQSGRLHRRRWPLPEGSEALFPDWPWLFGEGLHRRERRRGTARSGG